MLPGNPVIQSAEGHERQHQSNKRGDLLAFFAMIFGGAITFAMPIILVTLHTVGWTHDGFLKAAPAYSIIENDSNANIEFQELPGITSGGARIKQTFIRASHKLSGELLDWVTVGVREHQDPKKITTEPRVKAHTKLTSLADPGKPLTKTYIYAYFAVPPVLFLLFVYLFFSNLNPNPDRRWLHRRSPGYHMLLVSMLGGFASGMSLVILIVLNSWGHKVYFDNATVNTASVYIDGLRRVSLEPKTRIRFTLSGGTWDFRVESGGPDSKIIQRSKLRLHFFRPSNVIYNIENANSYWMD